MTDTARWDDFPALEAALRKIVVDHASPDPSTLAKLPKPYKKDSEKGQCDVCGGFHGLPAMHLDYMGHAEVTLALLDADPLWNWGAVCDEFGTPIIVKEGSRFVMWGWLEVCSVRRVCVGTCDAGKGEPEKELIGDLIRNGAMRFGIGVKLWSKATKADAAGSGGSGGYDRPRPRTKAAARQVDALEGTPGKLAFDRIAGRTAETQAALRALQTDERFTERKLSVNDMNANPEWLAAVEAVLDADEAS